MWLQQGTKQEFEEYRKERRKVKAVVREAKKEAEDRFGAKLSQDFEGNRKMFWKEVKRVRKGVQGEELRVKDRDGTMLVEGKAVRQRWAEYFDELLNVQDGVQASIVALGGARRMPVFGRLNDGGVESYEVEEGMSKMKGGKAPGLDQCAVEFVRKGGRSMVAWLLRLFNCCFETGRVPGDWCRACIVPLYKGKGDRCECSNSRGISLLSVVRKLFGIVLNGRISDGVIGKEQGDFRSGRGCVYQLFLVRQLCEKCLAKEKDLFWAFMYLEKAYDRVDRDAQWQVLQYYGVGSKLLKAVQSFYADSKACVRIGGEISE